MSAIRLTLFDFGNVLAHIDFNEFWRTLGLRHPDEIAPYADGYTSWTHEYEMGFISTTQYFTELQSVFSRRFDAKQLEQAFANIIMEPINGMAEIVECVSRLHRTALVSNTNELHYKNSIEPSEAVGYLRKQYLSYQLHIMKPAQEFYDIILKDEHMDPSEVLFIDDLEINVEGARAAGMHAIKFENYMQVKERLKALKILD